jgi:hypothetical protein
MRWRSHLPRCDAGGNDGMVESTGRYTLHHFRTDAPFADKKGPLGLPGCFGYEPGSWACFPEALSRDFPRVSDSYSMAVPKQVAVPAGS